MSLATTTTVGILFAVLAIVNASLMAWLWRFPLDEQGNTTAPKLWRLVHRGIGYAFAATYIAMLFVMLPRLARYQEFTAASYVHIAAGILIGPILIAKVSVIRVFKSLGGKLPWFGGALVVTTLFLIGSVITPALRIQQGPPQPGREVATSKCLQCHGPSRVLSESRSLHDWMEIADEMHDRAERSARDLSRSEAEAAAAYLGQIALDATKESEGEDEGGGRRRRGRDRRG